MNETAAPPKYGRLLGVLAIGCVLLAPLPTLVIRLVEAADLNLDDAGILLGILVWLEDIETLWLVGLLFAAPFIASRLLVNTLRARSKSLWVIPAVAIWWLLLAAAPGLLVGAVAFVTRQGPGRAELPDVRALIELGVFWFNGIILLALLLGVLKLRARSKPPWRVVGAVMCWLWLTVVPPLLLTLLSAADRDRQYLGLTPDARILLEQIAGGWLVGVITCVLPLYWGRKLIKALRARSRPVWAWIITVTWWCLLAVAPLIPLSGIVKYSEQHLPDRAPGIRTLIILILTCWSLGVVALAAAIGGGRVLVRFAKEPTTVGRLTWAAAGWAVLALLPGFLIGVFVQAYRPRDATLDLGNLPIEAAVVGSFIVILMAALIQGRIAGQGDVRIGLSDAPVSNRGTVAALTIWIAVYAALVSSAVDNLPKQLTPNLFVLTESNSDNLYVYLVGIGLAPLAEELFFRGWMWTALRKHSDVVPTALLTSLIWLVLHFPNGRAAPFLLIPVAIILSIARHISGSIRAPVALHAIYNFLVLILPLFYRELARSHGP